MPLRTLVVVVLASAMAGCIEQAPPHVVEQEPTPETTDSVNVTIEQDPSSPSVANATAQGDRPFDYPETDCYAAAIVFFPPTDEVQAMLPPPFVAEPAPVTMERAFMGSTHSANGAELASRTLALLEGHACRAGAGHAEAYLQVAIEPPPMAGGMRAASVTLYELEWAGHDPTGIRRSMGWPFLADEVRLSIQGDAQRGWAATVDGWMSGNTVFAFEVETAGLAAELPGGLARTWRDTGTGLFWLDWQHVTAGEPVAVLAQQGPNLSCAVPAASLSAQLLGATSCQSPAAQERMPLGIVLEPHDMRMTGILSLR